ncbi:MAG: type I restriction endonuclease subunit R [Kiritimatiellae bacterium]|nr:type I restriction endonuclease subunit R [Kiritimatiellia bacterium]
MKTTDTSEGGLESLIVRHLVEANGYEQGANSDYNREYAIDETRLWRFLGETQPEEMAKLGVFESEEKKRQFLNRLNGEIVKRGVIDVLRKGVKVYPANLVMFYMLPRAKNAASEANFGKNIFSVTRQLRYSADATRLALDLCVFVNGLPVITFELKNKLTKQCTEDAVKQYKQDRDPHETLFSFRRTMVHFAVDDQTVKFCTRLAGKESWFLPFNKGWKDGAGNPPNPDGIMTDYLWKDILTKRKLARIIENYAQVVEETDEETKKKTVKQIFPRYHQLDAVEKLLADVQGNGVGKRYLIEHSAGSGKSNSIAWLVHQLAEMEDGGGEAMFDSVIVVTDRRILDKQIRDTIKQFMQVKSVFAWAEHASDLKSDIEDGKRIIVTTIEKFPYIVAESGDFAKDKKFAIVIDEAHSGQNGLTSAKMNIALAGAKFTDDMDDEDKINALMEGRKLLKGASYFAFTATPKNKTLEVFGEKYTDAGEVKHRPFHVYTMKQAIQEGFILDVLANYTTIASYYKLKKSVEDDPVFDKKRAQKKLRSFVESDSYTIAKKAAMMVEHFHEQVVAKAKIDGKARAMVVTASIARCIEYYNAITKCLVARQSPYKAIIAFSGEHKTKDGSCVTSEGINGFQDAKIPKTFKKEPYRILVVADMYQTGFDEPLLHTMYVDKTLTDIKAVQTLSRLNRCHPAKHDTCVLDFANDAGAIKEAFSRYYKTTLLCGETDPNKLHDLVSEMEASQVFAEEDVEAVVRLYLGGAQRDALDPRLDACAATYRDSLDTAGQIRFKSAAKAFMRTYNFLSAILPYGSPEWERLSIFLNLLVPKLPSPVDEDLSLGILETIDLESYRNEAGAAMKIVLEDEDAELAPVPTGIAAGPREVELDPLSVIINDFNDRFGNIVWNDKDNVLRQIREMPGMVSKDERYQNAIRNSSRDNARLESDRALLETILAIMNDNMELFKQYQGNPSFKQWLSDFVFNATYRPETAAVDSRPPVGDMGGRVSSRAGNDEYEYAEAAAKGDSKDKTEDGYEAGK